MLQFLWRTIAFANIFLFTAVSLQAQKVEEPKLTVPDWAKPYPPFRIAGNLYYVGTYDLSCFLITTSKGNILINTGLANSAIQIKNNIRTLGFKLSDTKILLTTQAHYDHLGAMAAIKKMTGAKMMVDEADAAVLANGGTTDYALGGKGVMFKPLVGDRLLHDGDTIRLGEIQLQMLHHPGHTKGSCSFIFKTMDAQKTYTVLIANMPTIVTDKNFSKISTYPGIVNDYAYTLKAMKNLVFDIWVASHASQFDMHRKHKPGNAYNPSAFIDKAGYDGQLADLQKQYEAHINRH
ncbi:subclass B3 metallo-beta-lactamase [Ferruginibacter sp.]|uniref:subclass B3 metallo-beta-lactamase n=1 Tax=Ferruginibacter sp. TaxID=1940288 RepID=UPI0019A00E0D|nr:subclass B3 metallo-beta-lactamase [Ferruginibacter sp.]MBC7626116.1 subclass B3 metallo-beta-lactamase [Ferruginibacter sp.]